MGILSSLLIIIYILYRNFIAEFLIYAARPDFQIEKPKILKFLSSRHFWFHDQNFYPSQQLNQWISYRIQASAIYLLYCCKLTAPLGHRRLVGISIYHSKTILYFWNVHTQVIYRYIFKKSPVLWHESALLIFLFYFWKSNGNPKCPLVMIWKSNYVRNSIIYLFRPQAGVWLSAFRVTGWFATLPTLSVVLPTIFNFFRSFPLWARSFCLHTS